MPKTRPTPQAAEWTYIVHPRFDRAQFLSNARIPDTHKAGDE